MSLAALRSIDRVRVDELIALVLLAVSELHVWLGPSANGRLLPTLTGVLISVVLATRRRWPLAGMIVILAALTAKTVLGGPPGSQPISVLPALLLPFYGFGAFAPARRSAWVLALAVVISGVNTLTTPGKTASDLLAAELLVLLLPYALGRMARARAARERADREQAERLDARRELTVATAAFQERAWIARELHDVIAHSVSVMVIQAGGARMVMASEPERAAASLRSVERAGREALAEMRRLLGVLDGERDPRALAPQPRLADIEELLARARASGLAADLHVDGEPATVPPALASARTGSFRRRSRTRSGTRRPPARRSASAGRQALADLRRLLGMLRKDDDPRALSPQPGLGQLGALIDSVRETGLACELRTLGKETDLTPGVDLVAYRVVEVVLLTAADHRVSRGLVTVRYAPQELEVEVSGDRTIPDLDESLQAIAHRVDLYDGSLRALPSDADGFSVRAHLPL